MNTPELSKEQLEQMADELAQRVAIHKRAEDRALYDPIIPDPVSSTVVPESSTDPVTVLTPEAQAEVDALPKPEVTAPQITRKQWGEYLNKMFTVRNFAMPCGHKLLVQRNAEGQAYLPSDPKTNCHMCWFLYFQNNGNMTQIADQCFQEAGRDVLERSRGKKFVKYFLMFMSTMARFKAEQEAAAAEKEASNGSEDNKQAEPSTGGGSPSTDSGEPGPTGEAQEVNGVSSDSGRPSGGPETAVDEGSTEGLGAGIGPSEQGLDD